MFSGYWKRPELNKETFTDDGYFKTGDIFRVDEVDNYYCTDRIKELIKYSTSSRVPFALSNQNTDPLHQRASKYPPPSSKPASSAARTSPTRASSASGTRSSTPKCPVRTFSSQPA